MRPLQRGEEEGEQTGRSRGGCRGGGSGRKGTLASSAGQLCAGQILADTGLRKGREGKEGVDFNI